MPTLTADNTLSLSKRVELKPYKPRAFIPYEEMSDDEIFTGHGDLVFDSECFVNYFLAAFRHIITGKVVKLVPPFDPRKLSFILHSYRCVGFNSLKYDLPMLWASYQDQNNYARLKAISNRLVSGEWWQETCKEFGIKVFDTPHIDLMEVCPNQGSLKLYGARLHTPRLQELPYHHMSELDDYQKQVVEDYCINGDLVATAIIYDFNKDRMKLREFLGDEYGENVMSKSDAQMAETIVRREIKKHTGKWPKRPSYPDYSFKYQLPEYVKFKTPELNKLVQDILAHTFTLTDYGFIAEPPALKDRVIKIGNLSYTFGIGGLHSKEKNVSYKAGDTHRIIDRDVASYYPRIISTLKLIPEGLGPVFLTVFNDMTDRRLKAKAQKDFARDKGLKIAINGISGKFNSEHSVLWSPRCYIQMTLTGQLCILMQAEQYEAEGIQVISANTDGIVLYVPNEKYETLLKLIKQWEDDTKYTTEETEYLEYYARDVNAYFALKKDRTVKVKGPYSEVGSQTGTQLDNNPIMLICSDAIKKLLADRTPIEETINNCRDITRFLTVRNVKGGGHFKGEYLGKVVRWIYAKNEFEAIRYIESNNKVATTDGCLPVMDLPREFPDNIDYDRYIKETKEILYDIGYLQRPTQIRFF